MKKGVELTLNTVIIAALVIIVLVVLIIIFANGISSPAQDINCRLKYNSLDKDNDKMVNSIDPCPCDPDNDLPCSTKADACTKQICAG